MVRATDAVELLTIGKVQLLGISVAWSTDLSILYRFYNIHAVHWCTVLLKMVCSVTSDVSDSDLSIECTSPLVVQSPKKSSARHSASSVRPLK